MSIRYYKCMMIVSEAFYYNDSPISIIKSLQNNAKINKHYIDFVIDLTEYISEYMMLQYPKEINKEQMFLYVVDEIYFHYSVKGDEK